MNNWASQSNINMKKKQPSQVNLSKRRVNSSLQKRMDENREFHLKNIRPNTTDVELTNAASTIVMSTQNNDMRQPKSKRNSYSSLSTNNYMNKTLQVSRNPSISPDVAQMSTLSPNQSSVTPPNMQRATRNQPTKNSKRRLDTPIKHRRVFNQQQQQSLLQRHNHHYYVSDLANEEDGEDEEEKSSMVIRNLTREIEELRAKRLSNQSISEAAAKAEEDDEAEE